MKKYLAEGIGTMFLVLLACGSAVLAGPKIGVLGIGLCFGLVLLCLVLYRQYFRLSCESGRFYRYVA